MPLWNRRILDDEESIKTSLLDARVSTAHRPDGISVEQCVQRLLMNRLSIPSNIPEARLKLPSGRSSLFDAVAFFAFPNFVAPRPLCAIAAENEQRSRAKK